MSDSAEGRPRSISSTGNVLDADQCDDLECSPPLSLLREETDISQLPSGTNVSTHARSKIQHSDYIGTASNSSSSTVEDMVSENGYEHGSQPSPVSIIDSAEDCHECTCQQCRSKISFAGSEASFLRSMIEGHREAARIRLRLEVREAGQTALKGLLRAKIATVNELLESLLNRSEVGTLERGSTIRAIQKGESVIERLEQKYQRWEIEVQMFKGFLDSIQRKQQNLQHEFLDKICLTMSEIALSSAGEQAMTAQEGDKSVSDWEDMKSLAEVAKSENDSRQETESSSIRSESVLSLETLYAHATFHEVYQEDANLPALEQEYEEHDYDDQVWWLRQQLAQGEAVSITLTEFDPQFLATKRRLTRNIDQTEAALEEAKCRARRPRIDLGADFDAEEIARESGFEDRSDDGYGLDAELEMSSTTNRAWIERWSQHVADCDQVDQDEVLVGLEPDSWEVGSVNIGDSISVRALDRERMRINRWRAACGN